MIYLDANASTRVDQRVLDAMLPWFRDHWANPANILHSEGRLARDALRSAREDVGGLIGCAPDEIVFTSGASEANALAITGARPGGAAPGDLVTSSIEHQSTWTLALQLEARGLPLTVVAPNAKGFLSRDCLDGLPISEHSLVTLQWVNSETGVINDIAAVAEHVKARGGLIHVDAAQALGRVPIDLSRAPIDLLTLSAHKIGGPKGVGALFVREGVTVAPPFSGGTPRELRAGTSNVPGVVGLGAACAMLRSDAVRDNEAIGKLRDTLENAIRAQLPDTVVIGQDAPRVANTSMLGWSGLENKAIVRDLDRAGVGVGSGAACSTENPFGSRALRAMKVDPEIIESCVRFSLSRENTADEIAFVARQVAEIVRDLRTE